MRQKRSQRPHATRSQKRPSGYEHNRGDLTCRETSHPCCSSLFSPSDSAQRCQQSPIGRCTCGRFANFGHRDGIDTAQTTGELFSAVGHDTRSRGRCNWGLRSLLSADVPLIERAVPTCGRARGRLRVTRINRRSCAGRRRRDDRIVGCGLATTYQRHRGQYERRHHPQVSDRLCSLDRSPHHRVLRIHLSRGGDPSGERSLTPPWHCGPSDTTPWHE
jgi:hypothetical protein